MSYIHVFIQLEHRLSYVTLFGLRNFHIKFALRYIRHIRYKRYITHIKNIRYIIYIGYRRHI